MLAVALFVAHAVVLSLLAGEFTGAGPLDVAERAVQDGDAIEDSRGPGEGTVLVEHCLRVLPAAAVDEDDVIGRGTAAPGANGRRLGRSAPW